MSILMDFKESPKDPSINVRVWGNQVAKEKACIRMAQSKTSLVFIAWSTVTCHYFQTVFERQNISNEVILASDVIPFMMVERNFVFLERHYDHDQELKFLKSMNANEVLVHVSLRDPILLIFRADRIENLIASIGHQEDECIEHRMIIRCFERAMRIIKKGGLKEDSPKSMVMWKEGIVDLTFQ